MADKQNVERMTTYASANFTSEVTPVSRARNPGSEYV